MACPNPSSGEPIDTRKAQRVFTKRFAPVLAQLNTLLFEATAQGIQTSIEIDQFEGCIAVQVNVIGDRTIAGRLLAQQNVSTRKRGG